MVRRSTRRRNLKRGAGWEQGPPLSKNAYYVPEYKSYSDCHNIARPGAIQSNPDPAKAQTVMAGGRSRHTRRRNRTGTCGYYATRGGGCGCMKMFGGRRTSSNSRNSRTRKGRRATRGGRYTVDLSQSVGGDGPNVAPVIPSLPCEAHRAMPLNPVIPGGLASAPDMDVNVSGLRPGAAMFGGGPAAGAHPLAYDVPRAGFSFVPNIRQGVELNPGQIPYEEVIPQEQACTNVTCGAAIADINKH